MVRAWACHSAVSHEWCHYPRAHAFSVIAAAVSGAGLGVGYHPRPQLAQAANFSVRHNDLTALLFAQGVKPKDWAC